MRFKSFIVSLPLLVCAAVSSQAATMDAAQATALLAKTQALDVKCSFLAADQSQSLKDFVARAEISLAEKASVAVARKTIAEGRAAAKLAACDDSSRKMVNDVLAAANSAAALPMVAETEVPADKDPVPVGPLKMSEKPTKPAETAVAVAEPEPAPTPAKKPLAKAPVKKTAAIAKAKVLDAAVKPKSTLTAAKPVKEKVKPKGLKNYASVAETYYVAIRCGNMSRSKMKSLYNTVLASHKDALASNRPREVRALLRAAESRAGNRACT
jgi:hypothetical protein